MKTTSTTAARAILVLLIAVLGAEAGASAPEATAAPDAPGIGRSPSTDLAYMREEEKLAHDVYVTLGKHWDLPPFRRIPQSELQHMEAMRALLVSANLPDPAVGKKTGEFSDPHLRALYVRLVEQGSTSRKDALVVGATIEDLDLHDLKVAAAATKDENARAVYANLARASRNHLRAFTSLLAAEGGAYAPQFIDAATYASILAGPMERGGPGGCGRGGGRGTGPGRSTGGGGGRGGCGWPSTSGRAAS